VHRNRAGNKEDLKDSIYHLLNEYKLSSSFQDLARTVFPPKNRTIQNLFEKNARLINDIYPVYAKDKNKPQYPINWQKLTFPPTLIRLKKYSGGMRVNLRRANIDYSDLGRGKINIFIDREVRGKTVMDTSSRTGIARTYPQCSGYRYCRKDSGYCAGGARLKPHL
jgi:hypothetical protein